MKKPPAAKPSPVAPVEADSFPLDRLRVVLHSPRNPLNIGAVARAMSNLGFRNLRLVNAYDVAYREARSAVGASSILEKAEVFDSLAEAVADCSLVVGTGSVDNRELQHPLRRLESAGRLLRKHVMSAPAALVFGSEKYGLGNEEMSHCDWLLRIPTRRAHGSMNLGQAVAVCLYELARSSRVASAAPKPKRSANAAQTERLTGALLELLAESGYTKPGAEAANELKVRRLIRRMALTSADSELLLGMLRQIRWKVDQS